MEDFPNIGLRPSPFMVHSTESENDSCLEFIDGRRWVAFSILVSSMLALISVVGGKGVPSEVAQDIVGFDAIVVASNAIGGTGTDKSFEHQSMDALVVGRPILHQAHERIAIQINGVFNPARVVYEGATSIGWTTRVDLSILRDRIAWEPNNLFHGHSNCCPQYTGLSC
jgi:hypothetical protein